VGPVRLFDSVHELLSLVVPLSCCRSIFLAILYIDSNLCGTIEYGYGLFVVFKHSNSTFIMLYLVHEIDIDYLVVA
jgi:hypothetical protein